MLCIIKNDIIQGILQIYFLKTGHNLLMCVASYGARIDLL